MTRPASAAELEQDTRRKRGVMILLLGGAVSAQTKPEARPASMVPVPGSDNAAAWREHVLPTADELRWASIPWLQTFGAGVREADRQGKPLLLYAMNGHPLGCT